MISSRIATRVSSHLLHIRFEQLAPGKILKQPKNDQPGVIEVVINGTTVFCEYDHADIVVQAGPGELLNFI